MEYQETPLGTLEIVSDPSQFESFISPGRGRGRGGVAGPGLRGGRGSSFNSNKFIDFNKPWISQSIKSEIWKRKSLSEAARRSKSAVDVAALEKQSEFVESLIRFSCNNKFDVQNYIESSLVTPRSGGWRVTRSWRVPGWMSWPRRRERGLTTATSARDRWGASPSGGST